MMRTRHAGLALLAVGAAAFAGCGGSSKKDDSGAVRTAAVKAITSKTPQDRCVVTATTGLVNRVYGSVATCKRIEGADTGKRPTGATVTAISVNGDKATAHVKQLGGDAPNAEGSVALAKVDGTWKLDDLGADLLRSQLKAGFAKPDPDFPGLSNPQTQQCMLGKLTARSDAEFKAFAYRAIGEQPAALKEIVNAMNSCGAKGSSGQSLLREKFEEGMAQSMRKDGASEATIACVAKYLRTRIPDSRIIKLAADSNSGKAPPKDLTRMVVRAMGTCPA